MAKVFVGMSGGVDSSVTAALLKQAGHQVTGVYMKNWSQDLPGFRCPWQEDYLDAKKVAVQLGIDFKLYDFETDYRKAVVDYMVNEYQKGRTPNPDIMCNQEVKFKLFLSTALNEGADFIATGHYARLESGRLLSGLDKTKDQSYFLYRMDKKALKRSLMPLGGLHKSAVRSLATELGLVTADKKDSQGICFVGEVGIKDFLLSEIGPQPLGPIIDQNGKLIGQHDGAIFYTIGQRHGLKVGGGLPYYVTKKDLKNNTVYVTSRLDDPKLWHKEVKLEELHWLNKVLQDDRTYLARLRHRGPLVKAWLKGQTLKLAEPVRGLASGQSAVIYEGEAVLGGGVVTV